MTDRERELRQRRLQTVAVAHPVRHQVTYAVCATTPQPAHGHRASRGAIGVVIGNDHDMVIRGDGIGQQLRRLLRVR
ncbi:hypothetical protein D3C83_116280 [compost metagenome]